MSESSSASSMEAPPISWLTFWIAASMDMPASTQISRRSSASGKAPTMLPRRLLATLLT